ncbi:MAG: helicase HerA-like domain-containing protein [Cyclobacteriaceae bacterium]
MERQIKFIQHLNTGYDFKGLSVPFGAAILDGKVLKEAQIKAPLKTFNRHGLIAGATGTGKTKTLQLIAEGLSKQGVPVLLMDLKGDLSGLAKAGQSNTRIEERHQSVGIPFEPTAFPVELLTISNDKGTKLRATVTEFGPVLFSKILELNDTQSGIVSVMFKYCDDHDMPLLDLKDVKKTLQYIQEDGKAEFEREYGRFSAASAGTINRKILELEQQGANTFFGEKSFDPEDLLRTDPQGRGYISILRLTDIQDRPKLFSTFMLSLLAEVYATFPEIGDQEKPKLVIFIDEAHLIFDSASQALLSQIENIIKLIRSKGVGIFFCTQVPDDVPEKILSQLGLRVQHALRAITARDRKSIKMAAENFPLSDFYKTDQVLTSLGIGEALVTVLNEKGIPTPLAATMLCAPASHLSILSNEEIDNHIKTSIIARFYNEEIDRRSAYEILQEKMQAFANEKNQQQARKVAKGRGNYSEKETPGMFETLSKNTMMRQLGRTVVRELTRGIFGSLGVKPTRSRTTRR